MIFGISICNLNIQYYAIHACVTVIIGISFTPSMDNPI